MGRRLEKYLLLLVFEVLYEICLICTGTYEEIYENTGVDFGEARERRTLWSDTEESEMCLAPLVFCQ